METTEHVPTNLEMLIEHVRRRHSELAQRRAALVQEANAVTTEMAEVEKVLKGCEVQGDGD